MFQPAELATHEWPSRPGSAGEAPVAVLVHGITGWHRTWWRVAPAIVARGWRAVGIDLRGHGTSPAIGGSITAAELAADIELTLDRLGPRIVDAIVAHSLGAAVTMELAHRRRDIARRLVLEDPAGQTRADDLEYQATLEREVVAARRDPEAEIRREVAANPTWLEEDARQNVEGRARCDLDGILASLRGNTAVRSVDLAPQLRVPALYLVADEERSVLGERRAELLANLPPVARAIEFASGHTIHRDRTDEYTAAVLDWLENR